MSGLKEGIERNLKLNQQPDWNEKACSRNCEAFLLAGWEGRLGSKTSKVCWVKSNVRERDRPREPLKV